MRVENVVIIPVPLERTWKLAQDVPKLAPCIPGAELTEVLGEDSWRGKVHIKVGPITLQFVGDIVRRVNDEANRRIVFDAEASEAKGRGHAEAQVEIGLAAAGETTQATVWMDVALRGSLAQYGRGLVADVTSQIVRQFASNLAGMIEQEDAAHESSADGTNVTIAIRPVAVVPAPPKPIGGVRLVIKALWNSFARLFRPKSKV